MPSKPLRLRQRRPSWRHLGSKFLRLGPNFGHLAPIIAQISGESSPSWRPTSQKAISESPGGLQAPISIDFKHLQNKFSSILDASKPFHHRFLWLNGILFILTYHFCHHPCLRPCFPRHNKAKGPAAEAPAFK